MAPTQLRVLLVVGLVGGAIGWLVGRILDAYSSAGHPNLSWLTAGLLLFVAVLLLIAARAAGGWVRERRYARTMNALIVARLLAIAKAAAVFGALVCGGYAGYGLFIVQLLESSAGQRRALIAGVTAVSGLIVMLAALRLERACRVPPRDGPGPPEDEVWEPPAPWEDGSAHRDRV
jgi:Protein of unknown function (DUF3180)